MRKNFNKYETMEEKMDLSAEDETNCLKEGKTCNNWIIIENVQIHHHHQHHHLTNLLSLHRHLYYPFLLFIMQCPATSMQCPVLSLAFVIPTSYVCFVFCFFFYSFSEYFSFHCFLFNQSQWTLILCNLFPFLLSSSLLRFPTNAMKEFDRKAYRRQPIKNKKMLEIFMENSNKVW